MIILLKPKSILSMYKMSNRKKNENIQLVYSCRNFQTKPEETISSNLNFSFGLSKLHINQNVYFHIVYKQV